MRLNMDAPPRIQREFEMRTLLNMCRYSHKGAALLDKRIPNWHRRINKRQLDIQDYKHCVLGQLFYHYDIGLQALNITNHEGIALGVCAGIRKNRKRRQRYIILTSEWQKRITERLEADRARISMPKKIERVRRTFAVAIVVAISIIFLIVL